jgi:hypothetical protein
VREALVPAAAGAVAGALVGGLVWFIVVRQVDAQVSATIRREVPPQLRSALDQKFQSLGLTPQMASQIRTIVGGLDQAGIFSSVASSVQR